MEVRGGSAMKENGEEDQVVPIVALSKHCNRSKLDQDLLWRFPSVVIGGLIFFPL